MQTHDPAVAVPVERPVRPRAWMTMGSIDGKRKLEIGDATTNPEYVAAHKEWKWEPLYATADVEVLVDKYVTSERDHEAQLWQRRVDGLKLQLRAIEARHLALIKAVADGVAMQPHPVVMLSPEFIQAQADEVPRLGLGA